MRYLSSPLLSITCRHCAGKFWSVSTSSASRGQTFPITSRSGSGIHPTRSQLLGVDELDISCIDKPTMKSRCRSHDGADQVRPPSWSLPVLEVSIRCAGASLAWGEFVFVHPDAHAAP